MLKSRSLAAMFLAISALGATPGQAEPVDDWQAAITAQVEAFRDQDAAEALSFAAQSFKRNFPDPGRFLAAIRVWGYAPIIESRSHSFGAYVEVTPSAALQNVTFTGLDQKLYEAIYQLVLEEGAWRVSGVQMQRISGMGA